MTTTPHPAAAADLPEALRLAAIANSDGHITNIERRQIYAELHRLHALTAAAPAASSAAPSRNLDAAALVTIREMLERDPAACAGTAVKMIDAMLGQQAAPQAGASAVALATSDPEGHRQAIVDAQAGAESYPPCPKCGAPCTTTVHSRGGEWGWGTSDEERTTYRYAGAAAALRARGAVPSIEDLCARIKAADDAAADRDYMLDSDDCIAVLRGTWKGASGAAAPAAPAESDHLPDAGKVNAPAPGQGDHFPAVGEMVAAAPMSAQPSDAEIKELAYRHLQAHARTEGGVWYEGELAFARAVLSRWGAPQPPAAPRERDPRQDFDSLHAKALMRAWEEGWEACRDAEYVGEEAQNDAFNCSDTVNRCIAEDQLHPASPNSAALTGEQDAARLDWLEDETRKSRTGISFDCIKHVEDGYVQESGYRFMRHRQINEPRPSLRDSIDAAMAAKGRAEGDAS